MLALLLLSAALSGCVNSDLEGENDASGLPELKSTAFSHYLSNLSEPLEGVSLDTALVEQYRVEAADGLELDTWIVRPDIDGEVPVVLEVTPYYGGGPPVFRSGVDGVDESLTSGLGTLAQILVEHGYAFGISSVRGTGNSEGCFTQGGPEEGKDTAAVVEAVAVESWSNGNVGLIGVSYPGTTPQQVWLEAPPSLKTIVPISGISDLYKYNFKNGVPIWIQGYGFNTYYWPMVGLSPTGLSGGYAATDPTKVPGSVAGEVCEDQVDVQSAGVQATLDGNKGEYWQKRDFPAIHRATWDLNPERASVFYIHGLQDWNVKPHNMEQWLDQIQDSGVDYKVWLGQWPHAWPQRDDWWNVTVLAWFDDALKGKDTGILDAPAVQVQDDEGRWRHEHRWPPQTRTKTLHPHDNGTLQSDPGSGEVTYHDRAGGKTWQPSPVSQQTAPVEDALWQIVDEGQEGAWGPDRVVFRSEPLQEDMLLAGQPHFSANVSATGSRASLMLSLHEVSENGDRRSFNFGVLSLNHAEDLEQGAEDISGETLAVDLDFFPQDSLIRAGSRIELIAAANLIGGPMPAFEPLSDGSHITIHLDGARLDLPAVEQAILEEPQPCWEDDERENPRCAPMNR